MKKIDKVSFLIAMPQMSDANFKQSVILLLEDSSKGAFGLIINNPLSITLNQIGKDQQLECNDAIKNIPAYQGGPVQTELGWIVHDNNKVEEKQEILPGVYLSTSKESLEELLKNDSQQIRFFLGYSGWGIDQLNNEIKIGTWISTEANKEIIFNSSPKTIWNTVLKKMNIDPAGLIPGGESIN